LFVWSLKEGKISWWQEQVTEEAICLIVAQKQRDRKEMGTRYSSSAAPNDLLPSLNCHFLQFHQLPKIVSSAGVQAFKT
jgi:hypothetical protein